MLSLQDCFRFWVHFTHRRLKASRLGKLCHICCDNTKVLLEKCFTMFYRKAIWHDQKEGQKSYNLYSDQIEPAFLFQVKYWAQTSITTMNHQFNLFLSDQKGFVELPLLEGGVYICCPASEEEVRSDLNPIYQIDLIFQLNSQFAIHCEFPYCFKVDTALQKQVLEECFSFSINVFGNVHFQTLFNSISFSQDKWSRVHMQSKSSKLWGGGVEKYQQLFLSLSGVRGQFQAPGPLMNPSILLWKPAIYNLLETIELLPN